MKTAFRWFSIAAMTCAAWGCNSSSRTGAASEPSAQPYADNAAASAAMATASTPANLAQPVIAPPSSPHAPKDGGSKSPVSSVASTAASALPKSTLSSALAFDKDITPDDRQAVLAAMVPAKGAGPKESRTLSIAKLDLNHDGKPDYIVINNDPGFCGSAGCSTSVLLSQGEKRVTALAVTAQGMELGNGTTRGVRDLLLDGRVTWVWNGGAYVVGARTAPGCLPASERRSPMPPNSTKLAPKEVAQRFGAKSDEALNKDPATLASLRRLDPTIDELIIAMSEDTAAVRLSDGREIVLMRRRSVRAAGAKRHVVAYEPSKKQAFLLRETDDCDWKLEGSPDSNVRSVLINHAVSSNW